MSAKTFDDIWDLQMAISVSNDLDALTMQQKKRFVMGAQRFRGQGKRRQGAPCQGPTHKDRPDRVVGQPLAKARAIASTKITVPRTAAKRILDLDTLEGGTQLVLAIPARYNNAVWNEAGSSLEQATMSVHGSTDGDGFYCSHLGGNPVQVFGLMPVPSLGQRELISSPKPARGENCSGRATPTCWTWLRRVEALTLRSFLS
jgi:hypothetical protein